MDFSSRATTAAKALALGRVALGATAMVMPTVPARPWVGAEADRPAVKLLSRSMGARDIALGLGALVALRHESPVRGWVEAGGLCDAGDVAGIIIHFRELPRVGRLAILAVAGGSMCLSRWLAPRVDGPTGPGGARKTRMFTTRFATPGPGRHRVRSGR